MSSAAQILWSVSIRAISKQGLVQSMARGVLAHSTETSRQIRAAIQSATGHTPLGSVIAADPPLGGVATASILERYPNSAWMLAVFSGYAGTCFRGTNFSGGIIQALRSLLFRNPLVPVSPKTTSGSFQSLFISPVVHRSIPAGTSSLVASFDRHEPSERKIPNVGKAVGEIGNV